MTYGSLHMLHETIYVISNRLLYLKKYWAKFLLVEYWNIYDLGLHELKALNTRIVPIDFTGR